MIVGGACSGVFAALHLQRQSDRNLCVHLVDSSGTFGEGVAYGTTDEHHLLNVPAIGLSAVPDKPDDFLEFARDQWAMEVSPSDFLPRHLFAAYLKNHLAKLRSEVGSSSPAIRYDLVDHTARVSSLREEARGWTVHLHNGQAILADAVILATGHALEPFPQLRRLQAMDLHRRVISPYDGYAIRDLPKDSRVGIFGTGLSMIDAITSLSYANFQGQITAISRSGRLPREHVLQAPLPPDDPLRKSMLDLVDKFSAHRQNAQQSVHLFRATVAEAIARGIDWQTVFELIRADTPKLWQCIEPQQQTRLLRHARRIWDSHRHRMPPISAGIVQSLSSRGPLNVLAGRIVSIDKQNDALQVTTEGAKKTTQTTVDYLIDCTGMSQDVRKSGDPLTKQLLADGFCQADVHGMGFTTTHTGRLRGLARAPLYALGPIRRGDLWESTSVPELRIQATDLAAALLAEL